MSHTRRVAVRRFGLAAIGVSVLVGLAIVLLVSSARADAYQESGVRCHVNASGEEVGEVPLSVPGHEGHPLDYLGPCDGRTGADGQERDPDAPSLFGYEWTWDDIRPCLVDGCTTESVRLGDTIGVAVGGENTIVLFIAVRPSDEVPLYCEGFEGKSDVVIFDARSADLFGAPAEKSVTVTLLEAGTPADPFEACYGGAAPFTQRDGSPAVFDGAYWVGVLPDCEVGNVWPATAIADDVNPPPCVLDRSTNTVTGDVTLLIVAPPGDPLVKIG